jgi:hypothetical protein
MDAEFGNALKILKNKGQRRLLSRFPFPRHFPFRKHALSPNRAWKFQCFRKGFEIRLAGATPEF